MSQRIYLHVSLFTAALLAAGGCRGAVLELGDPPATCTGSACTDAAVSAENGSYALFHLDSDDYTRVGDSAPRQSYAFLGDVAFRANTAPLRFGCSGAFEVDRSGQCVLCTDGELPRGPAFTGSDVRLHSVTATGGELSSVLSFRWDGAPPGSTTNTISTGARAWGDGLDIRLSATFFHDGPIDNPEGGAPILEANANLVPPRYLVLAPSSTAPRATVSRKDDLVFAWSPREGVAGPDERVRITLDTKSEDWFDGEHRSTGRVQRVSCELASSSGSGILRSDVLRQMVAGEKVASMISVTSAEVVGPIDPGVQIPWLVRYELRSVVRTPEGDAFDAITLE